MLRSVFGTALYLAAFGLLSLALGGLIRRTAGAIAILIALLIFLPASAGGLLETHALNFPDADHLIADVSN